MAQDTSTELMSFSPRVVDPCPPTNFHQSLDKFIESSCVVGGRATIAAILGVAVLIWSFKRSCVVGGRATTQVIQAIALTPMFQTLMVRVAQKILANECQVC